MVAFALSKNVPQDPVYSELSSRGVIDADEDDYAAAYKGLNLDKPNFYFSILPSHYPRNLNSISSALERKEILEGLEETTFFYPKFYWNGFNNQYHDWLASFFSGGFGKSSVDGQAVGPKVFKALKWTLSISLIDILISFCLGIFLGIYFAKSKDSKFSKLLNGFLYALYSIPIFWLATLLIIFFTTKDYGPWTNIFSSVGMEVYPGKSTLNQIALNYSKLILPILCLVLHSLAYVSRFIQRSITDELEKPYVDLSLAKGISYNEIIKTHVLKNALVPLITIFVSAVIYAFAGSLVIEVIFNIPGVGRLMFNSIGSTDWNVVFFILLIIALVTGLVFLLGDMMYAYFNPKMRFGNA